MAESDQWDNLGATPLKGTYRGLKGHPSPQGRVLAPFDLKFPSGKSVSAFYDHGYRTPGEHYHLSLKDLHECRRLFGDPS